MKKLFIGLFLYFIFPIVSLAADYDIKNYYIDAEVKENGDMDVTELIVMKGTFNGYEVGIEFKGQKELYSASGIENVTIGGLQNPKEISFATMNENFEEFQKVTSAGNGDKLKYTEEISNYKNNYRMYYRTEKSTTAFLFKYTLKDVAIVHDDCVELYWNFFSDAFQDDIKDLKFQIHLPKQLKLDDFNWWFHGPLSGNSEYIENDSLIKGSLGELDANTPVDFRILLPRDSLYTTIIKKQVNDTVRETIIAEEDEIVAKDLAEIKRVKTIYYMTVGLTIAFYITVILIWIYVYKKYDKERKPEFQHDYNREFIEDYNVEVIDYLMNKSITPNAMSASIMNLIYKKNINFEEIPAEKEKDKDYKFTLVNRENINETEDRLLNFLFTLVGSGNEFTLKGLKKYASGTRTCDKFMNSYTAWNKLVEKDGKDQGFFENNMGKIKYGFIVFLLALIIQGIVSVNNVEFFPAYFVVFVAIIFIIYLLLCTKKTEKGIEHYAKWTAFKRFLNDFGTFNLKELPEIVLWERYLVYATIFGLADKVEKTMNVRINEIQMSGAYPDMVYISPHVHIAPIINSSIRSAYTGAQTAINRNNANASGGSFGGHGGGFSSGGGFGGGGRSGGGF